MAATGVMADFARLTPQRKAGLFAVIAAVLGLLYFQFVFKPLKQSVEDAENEGAAMTSQNRKLEQDIPKFAALRAKTAELTKIIEDNQKALPTEAELPEFFETLNRKVIEAGVDVRNWTYKSETPVDSFVRAPVEIEITGTFMQIKRFFASLVQKDVGPPTGVVASEPATEDRERIVSIDNLKLTNPTVVNHEIVLTARFTASTFRQEAPAAPAGAAAGSGSGSAAASAPADAGSASGSGSGSGSGSMTGSAAPAGAGSAAKPLPSAATPAGAKARVEQSLEKGDARNRNATGVDDAKTPANPDRLKGGL